MSSSVMILGTASGVGKTTVTAGLCRILAQDRHSVIPFKSQNMTNTAHILPDGRQMARSQAIAAKACGREPHPDMNPILLKILDGKMEVVLGGVSLGPMDSRKYAEYKKTIWGNILEPYRRLEEQADIVVIEGAGSPVELNLKAGDVVNMSVAQRVGAPVLLVADIDRGGVYASVYGTLQLFSPEERALVKGIIINKCKGRPEFFADVKTTMEKLTELPVLGLLPYLPLLLEDEDNLFDSGVGPKRAQAEDELEAELDRLAAALRTHLDMDEILRIIREGASA